MARSRLSLVVVLLLAASSFLNAYSKTSPKANSQSNGVSCVGLVKPLTENITLTVQDNYGQDNVMITFGNSSRGQIDSFTVKVMDGGDRKLQWNIIFSFGTLNCLMIRGIDVKIQNISMDPDNSIVRLKIQTITMDPDNSIVCLEDSFPTVSPAKKLCSEATMNKSINQRISTTDPPAMSTEPSIVQDEAPTTSSFPGPAAALMVMVVLEVVATCVVGGVVLVVIHGVRKTVKPATTNVQRTVSMRDLHICENDLYESFSGNAAADQDGTTEVDSQDSLFPAEPSHNTQPREDNRKERCIVGQIHVVRGIVSLEEEK